MQSPAPLDRSCLSQRTWFGLYLWYQSIRLARGLRFDVATKDEPKLRSLANSGLTFCVFCRPRPVGPYTARLNTLGSGTSTAARSASSDIAATYIFTRWPALGLTAAASGRRLSRKQKLRHFPECQLDRRILNAKIRRFIASRSTFATGRLYSLPFRRKTYGPTTHKIRKLLGRDQVAPTK